MTNFQPVRSSLYQGYCGQVGNSILPFVFLLASRSDAILIHKT